jgi:hypothetical protein
MTALAVPRIVELCALASRLGRSLSQSHPIIIHLSLTESEITIKTPAVLSDASHFHDFAGDDRRKNSIQPHRLHPAQFNEFYRQCSRRLSMHPELFAREHSR